MVRLVGPSESVEQLWSDWSARARVSDRRATLAVSPSRGRQRRSLLGSPDPFWTRTRHGPAISPGHSPRDTATRVSLYKVSEAIPSPLPLPLPDKPLARVTVRATQLTEYRYIQSIVTYRVSLYKVNESTPSPLPLPDKLCVSIYVCMYSWT